jgi:hypothetical protein
MKPCNSLLVVALAITIGAWPALAQHGHGGGGHMATHGHMDHGQSSHMQTAGHTPFDFRRAGREPARQPSRVVHPPAALSAGRHEPANRVPVHHRGTAACA